VVAVQGVLPVEGVELYGGRGCCAPVSSAPVDRSRPSAPIAFLSDFGVADEFVGVVHGVILRIAPDARIIDVGHQIRRGDVRGGALALLRAVQYLPPGVALAVVDPGVGSGRRGVALQTPWGYFVGPDNGLLAPAVAMTGGAEQAVSLEDPRFRLPRDGATFDGRDVFAPAAAVLASGQASLGDLGPEISPASLVPLLLPLAEVTGGEVHGVVWWVDRFGNAQTNVAPDDLRTVGLAEGGRVVVEAAASTCTLPWLAGYGEQPGSGVVQVDSYGLVAVAVTAGRADETFGLVEGTAVTFRRERE
jgi:S-adenosylmethionine hydrolase